MDRPALLSSLALAVVVIASFGALDAGSGAGTGTNADAGLDVEEPVSTVRSVSGATTGTPTTRTSITGTPTAKTSVESQVGTSDTATGPSNTDAADPTSTTAAVTTSSSVDTADPPNTDAVVYPPGTSPDGIEHPSRLLGAHTDALSRTGFVVTSTVNATVLETGMRIDATARGGARVAAGVSAYYAHRTDAAGPLKRRTQGYYNGEVERHRRVGEFGDIRESTQEARSIGELAGRPLLVPHLRGGAWNAVTTKQRGGESLVVFTATGIENASALESGLPAATTAVRSYDARAVVDSAGRIRSLTATAVYVLGGEPATFRLDYDLSRVGNASVERPDWVERSTGDGTGDEHREGDDSDSDTTACRRVQPVPAVGS